VIDFKAFGGPVYVGRANGAQARRKLKVDALDQGVDPVVVIIPGETYAVNSSFVLGLFGPSLSHFETRDAFLNHYLIQAPEYIQPAIAPPLSTLARERAWTALLHAIAPVSPRTRPYPAKPVEPEHSPEEVIALLRCL
jgi:hypothetical protein